jgi:uncharacterized protein YecE (DUF72 family)
LARSTAAGKPAKTPASIRIGTSGWHYKHWLGTWYPEGTKAAGQFAYYREHFDTVEINNSFYRLPSPETFTAWREAAPPGFLYAVKASRYITHMRKLMEPEQGFTKFWTHVAALKETLGPILFQLPPLWKINTERLATFLDALPPHQRYAFEFRNPTWYHDEVYALLSAHDCAFCIYELAGHLSPPQVTSSFVYVRLHGPGAKYSGSYTDAQLQGWVDKAVEHARAGRDVFVYFDNDELGHAAFNAQRMRELVAAQAQPFAGTGVARQKPVSQRSTRTAKQSTPKPSTPRPIVRTQQTRRPTP